MKITLSSKRHHYLAIVGIFLITVALVVGMVGCDPTPPPSQNLEIRDWYDLHAIRDNLVGHHILMNDLDSTTAGYGELASPTANGEKGWQSIRTEGDGFTGTFDGQGYEIRDLFINRPDEFHVGLFGLVDKGGVVENIGAVNVTVTGDFFVGGLLGRNYGTVSNSYSSSNVTGNDFIGGLVGANELLEGTVSNSYSTGSVTGEEVVGSLVGRNYGTIADSHSNGNVTGEWIVGGLVGTNVGNVTKCYSTGSVTDTSSVGGLVGENTFEEEPPLEGTVSNSFWDTETSGQATSDGGTGKNTTEMQDITTFSGAGWNIIAVAPGSTNTTYIWNIVNNVTYPFLSWQPVS